MAILIVERDNESSELIYEIFNKELSELFFVCDGAQALVAFRKYEISTAVIDLEISFVSAIDLIGIMRKENPDIKIIALTSNLDNCSENKYQHNYGFDVLIQKNDIHKYLYDSYLKLTMSDKLFKSPCKILELKNVDLNESLKNLKVFKKAFEKNIQIK